MCAFARILRSALPAVLLFVPPVFAAPAPTLDQVLRYPYVSGLVASDKADRFAWVENVRGVRNIWSAGAADSEPRQLTHYTADDGQELTQLTFSGDAAELLYVRGGDHDANWPAQGNLAPNPDNNPSEAKVTIWSISLADSTSTPLQVAEGDSPALSSTGQLAYVKDRQLWTAPLPRADFVRTHLFSINFQRTFVSCAVVARQEAKPSLCPPFNPPRFGVFSPPPPGLSRSAGPRHLGASPEFAWNSR